jgi:hypothetical protein
MAKVIIVFMADYHKQAGGGWGAIVGHGIPSVVDPIPIEHSFKLELSNSIGEMRNSGCEPRAEPAVVACLTAGRVPDLDRCGAGGGVIDPPIFPHSRNPKNRPWRVCNNEP